MNPFQGFRDPRAAKALLAEAARLADAIGARADKPLHIMEICGGHTHTIFRHGIDQLVHEGIAFVHGPGCPVCVLPMARIDEAVAIARRPGVIFTTFGDAMRVPGTGPSLMQARAEGADVRMVYSPLDALEIARRNPGREVVFFGIGFETTTPSTALSIMQADTEGLGNFSVFSNHITLPEPIAALLRDPHMAIDGFIAPGHVSMVIGTAPYGFIARDHHRPVVVSGFEPVDLLQSLVMVLRQISEGRADVENQYGRVVAETGNPVALAAIDEVYERRPRFQWRGLGEIEESGLAIRARYRAFDAEAKFAIGYGFDGATASEPAGAACAGVVTGRQKPWECAHFGAACTPETPLGALMVSSEGACAAYYQYGGARARGAGG